MGFDIDMVVTPAHSIPGLFPDCPGYIRLTSSSMAGMVEIMLATGVLDEYAEPPSFPDWPPAGLDEDRAAELQEHLLEGEEIDPLPTAHEQRAMQAYLKVRGVAETTRSQIPGRVPAFKFQSNDNWLVCPEECQAIAAGLDEYLTTSAGLGSGDIDRDGIRLWAAYNRLATEHGGYRVN